MNTKYAKRVLTFNIFLSSLVAHPILLEPGVLAGIFDISESALSGLRHGKQKRLPATFQPGLMASKFASDLVGCFPQNMGTVKRFFAYAQLVSDKCILSDSLGRYLTLFSAAVSLVDEGRAEKFCTGMLPALMARCYEEAYWNTLDEAGLGEEGSEGREQEIAGNRLDFHERTKLLLNVVYAQGAMRDNPQNYIDAGYLDKVADILISQVELPFYRRIKRKERISELPEQSFLLFEVTGEEELVSPQAAPVLYTLTQIVYHEDYLTENQIFERAFSDLVCTVGGLPLAAYLNNQQRNGGTAAPPFMRITREEHVEAMVCTEVKLQFMVYPVSASQPVQIAYQYAARLRFASGFPVTFWYALRYPCESFIHDFELDPQIRADWGIRVKMIELPDFGSIAQNGRPPHSDQSNGKLCRVAFQNWAVSGAGYFSSLYRRGLVPHLAGLHMINDF